MLTEVEMPPVEHLSIQVPFQSIEINENQVDFDVPCAIRGPKSRKIQWFFNGTEISGTFNEFKVISKVNCNIPFCFKC